VKISIYTRTKSDAGRWQYRRVKTGRGRRPADLRGPFFLRHGTPDGKRSWTAGGDTLEAATDAAERLQHALVAQSKGLTVTELDKISNVGRTPIKLACEKFLELKKAKAPKTLQAYKLHLDEFQKSLGRVRFMDEISPNVMRHYRDQMQKQGLAPKTQHTRLLTVTFLLKKNGLKNQLPWDEFPVFEVEPAVPFTPEELKKVFAAMDAEEKIRYRFFLGTGLREGEVTYTAWPDLDLTKGTVTVRPKADVGFTPKSHESRTVPLPAALVAELKERRKKPPHARWVFANEINAPEKHFLRKLKRIALHAGLNCGHCVTQVTKLKRADKLNKGHLVAKAFDKIHGKEITDELHGALHAELDRINAMKRTVTCKTDAVCQHWILHRFRKSCATRWMEAGVPVRQIQSWLGHKDLETTMQYLGTGDMQSEKTRGQIDAAFGD
jgi:integrase/recombinase XerD